MEFAFDDTLVKLRDRGHDIGQTQAEPSVVTRDRTAAWDPELFGTLARSGLAGALLPADVGGLGLSVLEAVSLLEGFGAGSTDAGLGLAIGVHGVLCGVPIAILGTQAQRERYLADIASGRRLGGVSLSELDGGATGSGGDVVAVAVAGGWRLEGTRSHVVNAPHANHFLLTAATGAGSRTAFLIDGDTPGLAVLPEPEAASLRTAPAATLVLTGCRVATDAVLGTAGAANAELVPLLAALDRTCLLAPWLGLLRALARHTLELAAGQPRFGASMARSQSVRLAVVDLHTQVELGADLLYRAAWQLGRLARPPRQDAAVAKLFVARAAADAARTAAGLAGLEYDSIVERISRDVLALAAIGGGEDVLRSVVADALLTLG